LAHPKHYRTAPETWFHFSCCGKLLIWRFSFPWYHVRKSMKSIWLFLLFPAATLPQRIDQLRPAGQAIVSPVAIRRVRAEYTAEARVAGLQGTVSLYLEVEPDGRPSNVKVLHGLGLGLDAKAIQAVQQWQFSPATRDGQPVRLGQSTNINFQLDNGGPWRIRLAAYRVVHDNRRHELLVKPLLSSYTAPDSRTCPIDGGRAIIGIVVGTDGIPRIARPLTSSDLVGEATAKAIESWRYVPATADGAPREANGSIEFECGPPLSVPGNLVNWNSRRCYPTQLDIQNRP
jgi:TonB family protein